MGLTGKALEDFLKWKSSNEKLSTIEIIDFRHLSQTSRNALIIEWFDSVGICIELSRFTLSLKFEFWHYTISDKKGVHLNNHLQNITNVDSRQQATKQAIQKANELYNERQV